MSNSEKSPVAEPSFENDPFCKALFEGLPPDIRSSLSRAQIDALVTTLSHMNRRKSRIDIRGEVSLFFQRYYYVFLAGPDRRRKVMKTLVNRRLNTLHGGTGVVLGVVYFFVFSILVVMVAFLLYKIKSFLDINIFPDRHLSDILSDFF